MFSKITFVALGFLLSAVAPLPQQYTDLNMTSTTSASGSNSVPGGPFRGTFTRYGTDDILGSQNCVTSSNACGVPGSGGPTAAESKNLFGVTGGAGTGPACGTCWSLTTDGGSNLVVRVNNLCPIEGNSLCSMQTVYDTNQNGDNLHFDLCAHSGAADSLMGGGAGFAAGNAVETMC